jgi:predicted MFS family arabinose efflux permease
VIRPAAAALKEPRVSDDGNLPGKWTLLAFLWGCYVLNHADRQVVYTLFPALQEQFGFSDAILGLTGALFLWVYAVSSPVSGVLGDRLSRIGLVVSSLAVWSTFTLLSGMSQGAVSLLTCRALLGVSESLFMPAAYALMANAHGTKTRSRAIAIFATSQMVGVAAGGSVSGYLAEHVNWRVSFWALGAAGLLFAIPLWHFLRRLPPAIREGNRSRTTAPVSHNFRRLLGIPCLLATTMFIAMGTFGVFLVYTWLPTFLYDKFSLGLSSAGFEASVYPQIGTVIGLLAGGTLADRLYLRWRSVRFWIVVAAFVAAAPCMYLIGSSSTLAITRLAAVGFGLFAGFIIANQVPAAFEVVPASLRATTIGITNFVGAAASGFAPFLGGMARKTIGVDYVMTLTAVIFLCTAVVLAIVVIRHFERDHLQAQEL